MAKKKKKEDQKKISEKIGLLKHEGKTDEQAAGEAYGMNRSGRLGRHGKYRPVGKRKSRKSSRR
jgi:hypothetical protein